MARPTKYHDGMPDLVMQYLDEYTNMGHPVPTIAGLSVFLDLTRETIHDWLKHEDKALFSDNVKKLMAQQEIGLSTGGLMGDYNASISKLMLTKHNYSDKTENENNNTHGGSVGVDVSVTFVEAED